MGFFDQLGASISKTVKEASEGAKTLADKNRVRKDIAAIENELRSRFSQIGEKLYELTKENPDPDFAELFASITDLKAALAEKRAEEMQLDGKYACEKCGTVNPREARFCQCCGTPAPEAPAEEAPAQGICANCGAQLSPDAVFCAVCGTRVEQPAPAAPAPQVDTSVCPNCGNPFEEGAIFCSVCGTKNPEFN